MVAKLKCLNHDRSAISYEQNERPCKKNKTKRKQDSECKLCVLCVSRLCFYEKKLSTNTCERAACVCTRGECNCGALMCVHQMLRSSSSKRRTAIERTLFWPHECRSWYGRKKNRNENRKNGDLIALNRCVSNACHLISLTLSGCARSFRLFSCLTIVWYFYSDLTLAIN